MPVDQAICKLKPPVIASKSRSSPARYSPFTVLLSSVAGERERTETPPFVTTASLYPRRPVAVKRRPLVACRSAARSAFVISLAFFSPEMPLCRSTSEMRLCGKSEGSMFLRSLFLFASNSRSSLCSSCSSVSAGFRSILSSSSFFVRSRGPMSALAESSRGPLIPKWVKRASPKPS